MQLTKVLIYIYHYKKINKYLLLVFFNIKYYLNFEKVITRRKIFERNLVEWKLKFENSINKFIKIK